MTVGQALTKAGFKWPELWSYQVYGPCAFDDELEVHVYVNEYHDAPMRHLVVSLDGAVREE